jgi:hypothetical protein
MAEQSEAGFEPATIKEHRMNSQTPLSLAAGRTKSTSVPASVLALFSMLAPLLLVAYTFAVSTDPIERAQMIVQGLESTIYVLAAGLVLRGIYDAGVGSHGTLPVAASQPGHDAILR